MFNPTRLELARKRRRLSAKALCELAKISQVTLSRAINGIQNPDETTVSALADALGYPKEFFCLDDADFVGPTSASFRSLSSMSAKERDAALSVATLAFEVADWIKDRFNLPEADLLDLSHERSPEAAAQALRQYWSIGERPISNVTKLLETKGVRVFALSENTRTVDAFSCWRNAEPYIFLNTFKTSERSRFDAAHELGHLVLHKHGGPSQGRSVEIEANVFASAFLMPTADVRSVIPFVTSESQIITAKKRWGVSAIALAYRLYKNGIITEWQYIQIRKKYNVIEPNGLPRETSAVLEMVLRCLWKDGISRSHIAKQLCLPNDEIESLFFGLAGDVDPPERADGQTRLRAVK